MTKNPRNNKDIKQPEKGCKKNTKSSEKANFQCRPHIPFMFMDQRAEEAGFLVEFGVYVHAANPAPFVSAATGHLGTA